MSAQAGIMSHKFYFFICWRGGYLTPFVCVNIFVRAVLFYFEGSPNNLFSPEVGNFGDRVFSSLNFFKTAPS